MKQGASQMTKVGYDKRKRNVLRRWPNIASDGADVMCDGTLLQKLAPETGTARLPTVGRLNDGTANCWKKPTRGCAGMARQRHGWSPMTGTLVVHCRSQFSGLLRRLWTGCAPGRKASGSWRARQ